MKRFSQVLIIFLVSITCYGQQVIEPAKGYSNDIGNMVAMLDDLKERITSRVHNLSQEETDFLLDDDANRIGAMILHLAATEVYYQKYTFEERGLNEEESAKWDIAQNLGAKAREDLQGEPIAYYLDIWDKVREETKRLLKEKDDKWFKKNVRGLSNHWSWFHVMEHQANHMGQITMIAKRARNRS